MLNDGVGRFHMTNLDHPVAFELPPFASNLHQNRSSPSGGRPEMNALGGIIEQDLNIIHKMS